MDPNRPRYAEAIIDQQSQLVRATVNVANVNAAATLNGFSASAIIFADQAAVEIAVTTAIANAGSSVGRFRIKVGDAPWLTVELHSAGFAFANGSSHQCDAGAAHDGAGNNSSASELPVENPGGHRGSRRSH